MLSSRGSRDEQDHRYPRKEFLGAGELWLECTPFLASLLSSSPSRSLLARALSPGARCSSAFSAELRNECSHLKKCSQRDMGVLLPQTDTAMCLRPPPR